MKFLCFAPFFLLPSLSFPPLMASPSAPWVLQAEPTKTISKIMSKRTCLTRRTPRREAIREVRGWDLPSVLPLLVIFALGAISSNEVMRP